MELFVSMFGSRPHQTRAKPPNFLTQDESLSVTLELSKSM